MAAARVTAARAWGVGIVAWFSATGGSKSVSSEPGQGSNFTFSPDAGAPRPSDAAKLSAGSVDLRAPSDLVDFVEGVGVLGFLCGLDLGAGRPPPAPSCACAGWATLVHPPFQDQADAVPTQHHDVDHGPCSAGIDSGSLADHQLDIPRSTLPSSSQPDPLMTPGAGCSSWQGMYGDTSHQLPVTTPGPARGNSRVRGQQPARETPPLAVTRLFHSAWVRRACANVIKPNQGNCAQCLGPTQDDGY